MARRGNGEGSIYYSEKLNKWVGQFTAGRKENGKLNRKSVYGNTRKEVKEKMTKALSEVQNKTFIEKSDITISMLAKELIEKKYDANIISSSTYYRNTYTLKHIQKSSIADIKVQQITSYELQNFINSKKEYSNSYIDKIYNILNCIFIEAIKKEIIVKNPIANVIKPKSLKKTKEIEALTIEEQKAFVNSLNNDRYKNVFLISLHSGMRVGEILALQPDDIDFDKQIINIDKTLTKDKNGKVIIGKTTKTYCSTRQIPITSVLKPILEESINNIIPNKNDLIFCQPNGFLIEPSTINAHFKRICKNAKIKTTIRPIKRVNKNGVEKTINLKSSTANTHMLRHTYATRCIESGVPAPVLQKLLGHKDISITLNTYTTIFDRFKNEALNNYVNYIQNI